VSGTNIEVELRSRTGGDSGFLAAKINAQGDLEPFRKSNGVSADSQCCPVDVAENAKDVGFARWR
jgi:hypothetical protein